MNNTSTSSEGANNLIPELRFPEFINDMHWMEIELGRLAKKVVEKNKDGLINNVFTNSAIDGIVNQRDYFDKDIADKSNLENYYIVEDGDYVYNPRISNIAPVGPISKNKTKKSGAMSPLYTVFRFTNINNEFYEYYFKSVHWYNAIRKASNMGARFDRMSITDSVFIKISVLSPTPIEQQKIASCLSSLDEVIAAHSQKLELLKEHKKGMMQNFFPKEGETVPKYRFKEFEKEGEWIQDTLINIAKFRRGSFPQPYGLPEWYDDKNGMPFIQVFDVGDDFRLKSKTKSKISSLAAKQSVFIPKETVIITIQGSIGRVAITQYDAYIDRTLLLFEELFNEIDKTFFAYVLFMLFEIEKEKAPGGIIKTITKEVLSDFVIKFPKPNEQKKIASFFSTLDDLIKAQLDKIAQLKLHKKGLMQGLFPKIIE